MGRGDAGGSAADRFGAAPAAPYEQEQPAGVLEDAPHGCHAWAMPGDGPLDPPGLSAPPAATTDAAPRVPLAARGGYQPAPCTARLGRCCAHGGGGGGTPAARRACC